jgi:hypothetical protein
LANNEYYPTKYIQKQLSNVHGTKIMNGSLRVAQDVREHNAASHNNKYSMKTVNECIGDFGRAGATIFSTLGLTMASGKWH